MSVINESENSRLIIYLLLSTFKLFSLLSYFRIAIIKTELVGDTGSGFSQAYYVPVQNQRASQSNVTPVDLHRYLSLTVAVGELLVIQHGFPKDQWNH